MKTLVVETVYVNYCPAMCLLNCLNMDINA